MLILLAVFLQMLWVRSPNESTRTWNLPTIWFIKAHVLHLVHILFINPGHFLFRALVSEEASKSVDRMGRCTRNEMFLETRPRRLVNCRVLRNRSTFEFSLLSKRFCAVREQRITGRWMEWVKEGEGKGEGREEGNACRQTPGFWKPPRRKQRCHAVINKPIKSSAFRRGSELWTAKTNFTVKTAQAFLSRVD